MKIVITGALGHIGSHLMRELPARFADAQLVLVDNLLTQRYSSLFDLPAGGRYQFVEADVLSAELEPIFTDAAAVIHLAAITDATSSFGKAAEVEQVNYVGTERVARACAAANVPLIFPSTTSVYGSQADIVDETCDELRPQSPYAESKLRAERLLGDLAASDGLRFVIGRFGTIFGTSIGMRFHTAVNKFCWQAVMGQPLTVWSTALDQYRPYLDLADAVAAISFIIEHELFDGRVYNVVTQNATVRDIVTAIAVHRPQLQVCTVDTPIMNQLSYHVLNRRFAEQGFVPSGDLARGIADTIALFAGFTDSN